MLIDFEEAKLRIETKRNAAADEYYDITATTVIDYDHYEMAPLETEDYCTATIPELMSKLSLPIFLLLMKKVTIDEAITLIKRDVLLEAS